MRLVIQGCFPSLVPDPDSHSCGWITSPLRSGDVIHPQLWELGSGHATTVFRLEAVSTEQVVVAVVGATLSLFFVYLHFLVTLIKARLGTLGLVVLSRSIGLCKRCADKLRWRGIYYTLVITEGRGNKTVTKARDNRKVVSYPDPDSHSCGWITSPLRELLYQILSSDYQSNVRI